jgi:peptidoglycan/xylan/chitin deacetylase (PgdA/CDA1 family)
VVRNWLRRVAVFCLALTGSATAAEHAVILEYHHVGTDTPAATSVTPATFEAHLDYLAEHDFRVWPLSRVLGHLQRGEALPENTVALTFDDAYESVHRAAFPRLRERGWPFTVFVSTDYIDKGYSNYMSWAQLRELGQNGAELGNHSRSHPHMVRRRSGEDADAWRQRVTAEIAGAQKRLTAETDSAVRIFAYPYGEFTDELATIVGEQGYLGVGQQSGAVGTVSDLRAAPRFPLASGYADIDRFATKVNSRPLPVTVLAPDNRLLGPEQDKPALRFRLGEGDFRAADLACYAGGQGRMSLEWVDRDAGIVAVRPKESLGPGRTKYNCTAPSASESGVFYWYSHLWMKRADDGGWYAQ